VKAADDDAVVGFVQKGQGETLVATRVRERVETDQAHLGEVMSRAALDNGHPGREFIEVRTYLVNRLEVLPKDRLKVAALNAASKKINPMPQAADLRCQQDHHSDQTQSRQHKDDGSQVVGYRVHKNLRSVAPESTSRKREAARGPPARPI
jgi:hypothetical protein